jgi:hypothetical protein
MQCRTLAQAITVVGIELRTTHFENAGTNNTRTCSTTQAPNVLH